MRIDPEPLYRFAADHFSIQFNGECHPLAVLYRMEDAERATRCRSHRPEEPHGISTVIRTGNRCGVAEIHLAARVGVQCSSRCPNVALCVARPRPNGYALMRRKAAQRDL